MKKNHTKNFQQKIHKTHKPSIHNWRQLSLLTLASQLIPHSRMTNCFLLRCCCHSPICIVCSRFQVCAHFLAFSRWRRGQVCCPLSAGAESKRAESKQSRFELDAQRFGFLILSSGFQFDVIRWSEMGDWLFGIVICNFVEGCATSFGSFKSICTNFNFLQILIRHYV